MRNLSLLVLLVSAVTTASAAGPDANYKAPRTENGQPDVQGVWNIGSDVPLERPASAADKNIWTRAELEAQKAATMKAFDMIAKIAPVEAVGLTWLDYAGRLENLRTSLITYPENGRVPKLVEGVRRVPGPEQLLAALADPKSAQPSLLSSLLGGSKKDGPEDLSVSDRCLLGGGTPLIPGFDNKYVQIIQSKDTVALVTDDEIRLVPLDGRPHLSERLRSWGGDSRGRWEGDTLVIETRNFNRRTHSFAGAGNSLDKIVLSLPMAKVEARIYEYACHEGNYSLPMMLAGARKDEREGNAGGPPPRLQ